MSGACTFLRKKYSYLDVAPEPLAFRNEELEGLLKLNFGRLVLGVSFLATFIGVLKRFFSYFALGWDAQACFQPFCFFVSGVSF